MLTKMKIAVAALLVLNVASAAQAGSRDDADSSGGFPVGRSFDGVNPALHPELGRTEPTYDYAVFPSQQSPARKKASNH